MRSVLRHPARAALAGALATAFSAILYRTAEVSPETGAFFRCVYALPVLWLFVRREERRLGRRPRQLRLTAWAAGAFFAADLLLWHHAIEAVGAGLASVLGNIQVVLVGLIAWALFRERLALAALAAIPIAMLGIVLTGWSPYRPRTSKRSAPSSARVSHAATERTKMCASGFRSNGPSIALRRTLAWSDFGQPPPKRFDPQVEQKVFAVPSAG